MGELHRSETTHIDEVTRMADYVMQWQLELRNRKGGATHPITHNNQLQLFICGQQAFSDILARIGDAEGSIDLCCWGFDPGMELVRVSQGKWPRGTTFGDALIRASRRGVKVRLLVWHDAVGSKVVRNMPGYSHDTIPWYIRDDQQGADEISAEHSVALLSGTQKFNRALIGRVRYMRPEDFPVSPDEIPAMARAEYCHSWYLAVMQKRLPGIEIRMRSGRRGAITQSLASEKTHPANLTTAELEAMGMEHLGTHHQKTILIDYAHDEGSQAVGYVMGLNSVTDYWDTAEHILDDPRREQAGGEEPYQTLKPYQDYACRINGGQALIELHENFAAAWARAGGEARPVSTRANPPAALLRKARPGDSTVQIVRTQPEEGPDKTIREAYFLATSAAASTHGYLYIENQYFQYEEWAQVLLERRRETIRRWKKNKSEGKTVEDLPDMYVFIVIPAPERKQMIPRTYDALAALGQQSGMVGQSKLIHDENRRAPVQVRSGFGTTAPAPHRLPDVVAHANSIDKPNAMRLESEYGLKVFTAMLNTCDFHNGRWRYREIYIHSKLMIASDLFFTLGSANLNQRSMAVDSELNMAVCDPVLARDIRQKVWSNITAGEASGGNASRDELAAALFGMQRLAKQNETRKNRKSQDVYVRRLTGLLMPFQDDRSSLSRLG